MINSLNNYTLLRKNAREFGNIMFSENGPWL